MGESVKEGLCGGTVLWWAYVGTVLSLAYVGDSVNVGICGGTGLIWAYVGDSVKVVLCGGEC